MNKILKSLFTIAIVAVVAVGATQALFDDTEKSIGNTFTTGTIDIAVDGENPWMSTYDWQLDGMKPSYTGYLNFEIVNVGTNPANVWKTLTGFNYLESGEEIILSEPECIAEGGEWVDEVCTGNHDPIYNIDSQINYDLRVELYEPEGTEPVWWETIYMDSDNFKMSFLKDHEMYLGMIPVGWSMKVIQSYHMVTEAGNEYQGDGMSFNIELYAEQLTNTVRLVNKYLSNTDVSHHVWNSEFADFSYKVMDSELNWELATTSVPNGDYTLLVWDDSDVTAYDWDWAERSEAVVLAKLTVASDFTHSGTYDPIGDIKNAKVWLVPGHFGTEGDSAGSFPWVSEGTFFETGLIDFYDSLL